MGFKVWGLGFRVWGLVFRLEEIPQAGSSRAAICGFQNQNKQKFENQKVGPGNSRIQCLPNSMSGLVLAQYPSPTYFCLFCFASKLNHLISIATYFSRNAGNSEESKVEQKLRHTRHGGPHVRLASLLPKRPLRARRAAAAVFQSRTVLRGPLCPNRRA